MIESYDFCRIAIEGGRFGNGAVIFPDRINGSWWSKGGHILSADDVKEIVNAKPEVFIVGT